ncbi:MAG: hypothetical protein LBS74_06785 [Oscillospiraceae bacterium]|nr:hypothetical protein [Oscillospiraceae bacterium]
MQIGDISGLTGLRYFKKLKHAEMNNCGIPDEEMGKLREQFAAVKFVWTVEIGVYKVRTDTLQFSSGKPAFTVGDKSYSSYIGNAEAAKLKYCTDLEALDLGHKKISDLSFLSSLTKLKILILAHNRVSDISAIENLKDLEYLEIFLNEIKDASVFAKLPKLKDLNLCHNFIKDISPILECKQLERLWISYNELSDGEKSQIAAALPNCQIEFDEVDSVGAGWRKHPRYYWMRDYFGLEYMNQ